MAKLVLSDVSNPQNESTFVATINNNSDAIEAAIENTLSRDGTSPNEMESDLDMNSNRILNLPLATSDTEPVRKGEFDEIAALADNFNSAIAEAEAAATEAAASAAEADASLATFNGVYLGPLASDPTLDANGDPIHEGDLYFNTVSDSLKIYDGAVWQNYSAATGIAEVAEDNSPTLGGNLDLGGFQVGDADAADLTKLAALTATATELNYVDGVTSAIQTQLDAKQDADSDLDTWAGITPGTGVATALAVNVGTAGAFVTNGGALGTPSSGTLTNCTGLPVAGITSSTSTALGVGSLELGAAADTTVSRASAGIIQVEGVPLYSQVPQNSQSAAYTTVIGDAQKHILHPTADNNARTFTIDSNANVPYPIGTCITFINQINTVTISITSDTLTLAGSGSTGSRTLAANGIATAIKVGTTSWVISGIGLT